MNEVKTKPFNTRAFWSVLAAVSMLGLPWTGIENHLYGFQQMSPERHAWMAAHNVLAALFVVAAVAHVALNWRPLLRHLRGLPARLVPVSREALVALALTAVLLFLFIGHTRLAPG